MKKFIKYILVLLLSFVLVVIALEFGFKNHKNFVAERFDTYYSIEQNVDIVFLGNSHVQALKSPQIGDKTCFNFGFGGQDIFHMYAILNTIIARPNQLEYVVIGLDYELLGYNYEIANTMWLDRLYYENTKLLYDNSLSNRIQAKSNFFISNRSLTNVVKNNNQSKKQVNDELNFIVNSGSCKDRAEEHSIVKFNENLLGENTNYLLNIITLCKENEINLIFTNLPKTKCYINYYDKNTIETTKPIIDNLVKNHNIKFVDFWDYNTFCDSVFLDYDHLNPEYNYLVINELFGI